MHQERRAFPRLPVEADVRLYHPLLGSIRARIEEWSPGAVRLTGQQIPAHNGHDFSLEAFQLEPEFMDVIFSMQFVRLEAGALVLSFIDEGELPGGGRL